ncbi:MAG TPA: Ig-like domain-containing protein [Gemmatimonadales bacterium]|jgi:hypothetical protein|nr:Ig-like domain-containing protein [Gemmatimonadales bacterium]
MNFRFKLSRRLARIKLAAVTAGMLVLGCNIPSSPAVVRIEAIQVAPARVSLVPFQPAPLTVDVFTGRGGADATALLQWSTTGGSIANNGSVAGTLHVTYTSPAQPGNYLFIVTTVTGTPADTANIAVTATPVPVNAVTVTPGSVSLVLSDTTTLRATLMDSTGSVLFGRPIEWSSSDAGVATVLVTGFVRAMGTGTTTITATSEGHSATAVVTVHP